jgi:hypothetical protein
VKRILLALVVFAAVPATATAAAPVVVRGAFEPRAALFADPIDARVDVLVDPRAVDPAETKLALDLGSWTQVGPTRIETERAGGLVRRRWLFTFACRSDSCAPAGTTRLAKPPAARVTIVRRDGTTTRRAVSWGMVVVASRLPSGAASASPPPFDLQTTPPAVRTWIGSSTLAALLDALAALLVVAALFLVGQALRRRRVPAPDPRSPLERALALAREAEARPAPDRRRALALLARVSGGQDAGYAADAASAAWRPDDPSPERVADLVGRGERLEEGA